MRVLIDINDPADAYLFSKVYHELNLRGHEVLVTARDKNVTLNLLDSENIPYYNRGTGGYTLLSKAFNLIKNNYILFTKIIQFKPDILLGSHNMYLAQTGRICGIPSVICADTEHDPYTRYLTYPFACIILTPVAYRGNAGKNQVRYHGYHPLAYLHPKRFIPDSTCLSEFGLTTDEPFILVRLVSWKSVHNIGHTGVTDLHKIISRLSKFGKVFISAEDSLPGEFEHLRIQPARMHDILYFATLVYGEGATITSEAAVLGTHAIFCDFAGRGYTDEQEEKFGLVHNFGLTDDEIEKSLTCAEKLLSEPELKEKGRIKQRELLTHMIDLTGFLVAVLENWPDSKNMLMNKPDEFESQFFIRD